MARTDARRVTPREAIQALSDSPRLRVATDQSLAGSGRGMFAIADAINGLGQTVGHGQMQAKQSQDKKDYEAGASQRLTSDLTGDGDATLLNDPRKSDMWKRGYLEVDGLIRARDWQRNMVRDLAAVDPNDPNFNFEDFLKQKSAEAMGPDAGIDPITREAMVPAMSRAADSVREAWAQQTLKEDIARQEDALGALATEGFKDGSLAAPDGLQKFYALAGSEKFAFMHPRDVDRIVADAAVNQMASGEVDPKQIMDVLEKSRSDGTPGLAMNPKFREEFTRAAAHGASIMEQKRKAALQQEETRAVFTLDDVVDKSPWKATDRMIQEYGDKYGWTPEQRLTWRNRRDARIKELQNESKKGAEDSDVLAAILKKDYTLISLYGNEKAQGVLNKALLASYKTANDGSQNDAARKQAASTFAGLFKAGMDAGVDLNFVKQTLARFDPTRPQEAKAAVAMYQQLKGISPDYADRVVPNEVAARFAQYSTLTDDLGASQDEALAAMAATKPNPDGAAEIVSSALRAGGSKYIPTKFNDSSVLDGKFRDTPVANAMEVQQWIVNTAKNFVASGSFADGDSALQAASKLFQSRFVRVGNRYQPAAGLNQDSVGFLEETAKDVKAKLVAGGHTDEAADLYFKPVPSDPGKWVLVEGGGITNFPVIDPDTGEPVTVDPRKGAGIYADWKRLKSDNERVVNQALHQEFGDLGPMATWEKQRRAMRAAELSKQNPTPSFIDFINQQH